jgi:hypothetical protein
MSREFGSYEPGYFHYQMDLAAQDCREGNDELTRLWGGFLSAFYPIAYAIASSEAGDSGPDFPVNATKEHMAALRRELDKIEQYVLDDKQRGK